MEKIASFTMNHNTLTKGMFTSRVDGDIITYDIRMTLPNRGDYLDNNGIHTFEHLFATFARNSTHKDNIIYIGPMGCRTGFYFLVREAVSPAQAIALVRNASEFISCYEGNIPGSTAIECGNAAGHDLQSAQKMASDLKEVLATWNEKQLLYPTK